MPQQLQVAVSLRYHEKELPQSETGEVQGEVAEPVSEGGDMPLQAA